jgi:hypothetical protein
MMDPAAQLTVPSQMFDDLQQEWAPLDDPVFQLVPPSFHTQVNAHYTSLGCPVISKGTFWSVYTSLLGCFRASPTDPTLDHAFHLANLGADDKMELIAGLQELRNIDDIVGDMAVAGDYAADFTDSDDNNEEIVIDGRCESVYGNFTDSGEE